jgi:hypothetical protein
MVDTFPPLDMRGVGAQLAARLLQEPGPNMLHTAAAAALNGSVELLR